MLSFLKRTAVETGCFDDVAFYEFHHTRFKSLNIYGATV